VKPRKWLKKRGQRRADAVDAAYGMLGLDYGKGHLDDLYLAAYQNGYADAMAVAVLDAHNLREIYPLDVLFHAQHDDIRAAQAREAGQ